MPVSYRINQNIVEMSLDGDCPPDEVIATFHRVLDDELVGDEFFLLLDVRNSTSLATRATQEIVRVAEYLGPYQDRVLRCAVLATENVHFGLSRLGAVYSETAGVMTSVFRDYDEAVTWLHSKPE